MQVGGLALKLVFLASIFGSIKPFFPCLTWGGRGRGAPLLGEQGFGVSAGAAARVGEWASGRGAEVERQLRGGRGGALSGHGELEVLVGRRPGGTALDPRFRRSGREICIWHILEFASLCGDGNGCAHRVSACVTETFKLVSEMVASPYTPSRLTKGP